MSNFVFYDLETSDSALIFSQILEASFIICNDNLEELERATFFARLNKTYIPHPGALLTNGVSVKRLKETGKNVIVIFANGRPISEPWISENINAIIEVWEPGSVGGLEQLKLFLER